MEQKKNQLDTTSSTNQSLNNSIITPSQKVIQVTKRVNPSFSTTYSSKLIMCAYREKFYQQSDVHSNQSLLDFVDEMKQYYGQSQLSNIPEMQQLADWSEGQSIKYNKIQSNHKGSFSNLIDLSQKKFNENQFLYNISQQPYQFQKLKLLSIRDFNFKITQTIVNSSWEEIKALHIEQCSMVRIIKNDDFCFYTETNSEGLVPLIGKIVWQNKDYSVVSKQITGSYFNYVLKQFGCFHSSQIQQNIICLTKGLKEIHKNGKSFNLLTPDRIIVDNYGFAWIDITRSKPVNKITLEDKKKYFYYLSPELILENKQSEKNDVWSLGSAILSMVIGQQLSMSSQINSYNFRNYTLNLDDSKLQLMKERYTNNEKVQKIRFKINEFIEKNFSQLKEPNSNIKSTKDNSDTNEKHIDNSLSFPTCKSEQILGVANFQNSRTEKGQKTDSSHMLEIGQKQQMNKIEEYQLEMSLQVSILSQLNDLMNDCLKQDYNERPSISQLVKKYRFLSNE